MANWNSNTVIYGKHNYVITGIGVFSLDNGKLLLKKTGEDYPCPLTGRETHALLNLLFDHRTDIIAANTEIKKFGAGQGRNKKAETWVDKY